MDDGPSPTARQQEMTGPRQRAWPRWLVVHVVVALLVTAGPWAVLGSEATGEGLRAAASWLGLLGLVLGLPWSVLPLVMPQPADSPDAEAVVAVLVVCAVHLNVVLHACAFLLVRVRRSSRRRTVLPAAASR